MYIIKKADILVIIFLISVLALVGFIWMNETQAGEHGSETGSHADNSHLTDVGSHASESDDSHTSETVSHSEAEEQHLMPENNDKISVEITF